MVQSRIQIQTLLAIAFLAAGVCSAEAQYFGRNKVQHDTFEFKTLKTDHFDIYYYEEERVLANHVARMAERWYARLTRALDHHLSGRQPLVLYASHPHFEQTNVVSSLMSEGTGGVTEGLRRRIVLPAGASLAETDHVVGHELVHAFQYDIGTGNMPRMALLPLWFVEGMAEYLSLGPNDPHTAMWMRDAVLSERLPTIKDLWEPKYFPYRYGQALWAYLGSRFGDKVVGNAMYSAMGGDAIAAIETVTGVDEKTLSKDWHDALRKLYAAAARGAQAPHAIGVPLITKESYGGEMNVAPAISPDGTRIIFLSEKNFASIDMFLADAATGKITRKLIETSADPHFDSLQFINSAGSWDASGKRFAVGAIRRGRPYLAILDIERGGRIEREIPLEQLGEIFHPTWSPDGKRIAFSAIAGGETDLYVYDLDAPRDKHRTKVTRVTRVEGEKGEKGAAPGSSEADERCLRRSAAGLVARWQDDRLRHRSLYHQPEDARLQGLSPRGDRRRHARDARTAGRDADRQARGEAHRAAMVGRWHDALLPVRRERHHEHLSPDASPPARSRSSRTSRPASPASRSSARRCRSRPPPDASRSARSARGEYGVYTIDAGLKMTAITPRVATPAAPRSSNVKRGRIGGARRFGTGLVVMRLSAAAQTEPLVPSMLAPPRPGGEVVRLLENPTMGLPPPTEFPAEDYDDKLKLDYVGQPTVVAGANRYGAFVGGGVSFTLSDMLGDRTLGAVVQMQGEFDTFGGQPRTSTAASGSTGGWWRSRSRITGRFRQSLDTIGNEPVVREQVERFNPDPPGGGRRDPRSRSAGAAARIHRRIASDQLQPAHRRGGLFTFDRTSDLRRPPRAPRARFADARGDQHRARLRHVDLRRDQSDSRAPLSFRSLAHVRRSARTRACWWISASTSCRSLVTVAARVLHFGRYGSAAEDFRLTPLYLGYPHLHAATTSTRSARVNASPTGRVVVRRSIA